MELNFGAKKSVYSRTISQLSLPVFIVNCCRKGPRDFTAIMLVSLLYEIIMKFFLDVRATGPRGRLNGPSLGSAMFFRHGAQVVLFC